MDNRLNFPVADARRIVHGLTGPKPAIYWADFLVSITVAYGAVVVYFTAPFFSLLQFVSFSLAAFALYRVSLFMHELVHFKPGEMTTFKVGWNILAGIPMLTPSFFYVKSHRASQHSSLWHAARRRIPSIGAWHITRSYRLCVTGISTTHRGDHAISPRPNYVLAPQNSPMDVGTCVVLCD
jgi:hypothetical protein